ncbi:MAG: MaoC family dehydratase [Geodermatophilaceae bacterium]|nr:MaoC family dehydratase [Geodermatophilaceae bacterium]
MADMTTNIASPDALLDMIGADLGTSDWVQIPQSDVNAFAKATKDEQWIHVDPERAAAGPFGATIVHGYMTLSMLVPLLHNAFQVEGVAMGINYGLNKVRFPAPTPVGSRVRVHAELVAADRVSGGVQAIVDATVEAEGVDKPVCVAQSIVRYYPAQ